TTRRVPARVRGNAREAGSPAAISAAVPVLARTGRAARRLRAANQGEARQRHEMDAEAAGWFAERSRRSVAAARAIVGATEGGAAQRDFRCDGASRATAAVSFPVARGSDPPAQN